MHELTIDLHSLVDMIKKIVQQLLWRRLERKAKCYMKIDFQILDFEEHFIVQLTKCSSGLPNLKVLFSDLLQSKSNIKKLDHDIVIATVEEKIQEFIQIQKIIYSTDSSIKIFNEKSCKGQREFALLKYYISIKILVPDFQVEKTHFKEFSSLLLSYFTQIEDVDSNIKILLRKGQDYIYRNHVRMDDIILSCKIFNSTCASIFLNSQDDFKKNVMDLLGIKNQNKFEKTVGCLLLAQVNNNFKRLSLTTPRCEKSLNTKNF